MRGVNDMATVEIQLKSRLNNAIQRKLSEINNPTTMLAVHNTLAKMCDPYVPFLEGPLSQTVQVSSDGVRYTQPYARYQYFGDNFNFTLEKHPLASARWDKAMMRDHGGEFIAEVEEILRRRIELYGRR